MLPGSAPAGIRTHDLSITSPTPYHYTTESTDGHVAKMSDSLYNNSAPKVPTAAYKTGEVFQLPARGTPTSGSSVLAFQLGTLDADLQPQNLGLASVEICQGPVHVEST